jgi:hypothetical protein
MERKATPPVDTQMNCASGEKNGKGKGQSQTRKNPAAVKMPLSLKKKKNELSYVRCEVGWMDGKGRGGMKRKGPGVGEEASLCNAHH